MAPTYIQYITSSTAIINTRRCLIILLIILIILIHPDIGTTAFGHDLRKLAIVDYWIACQFCSWTIEPHGYQAIGPLGYAWGRTQRSFRCPNRWRNHAGGIVIEEIMPYVGRNAPISTVESKGTTVEEHPLYIRGS